MKLRNTQRRVRVDSRRIRKGMERLLEAVGHPEAEVGLLLVGDRRMAVLHEQWMGEKGPTDVISFPMGRPPGGAPELLGDIVISAETARRCSPEDPTREVIRYMVHGLLHLLGHDHRRLPDRRRMNREARCLQRLVNG